MATEKVMETAGEITDVKAFASAIKRTLEREYPDSDVEIHEVPKNNSKMWTGIVIRGKAATLPPRFIWKSFSKCTGMENRWMKYAGRYRESTRKQTLPGTLT